MKNRIMCHLVAGYPGMAASREVYEAFAKGGAAYCEVQFPFSDPAADGPDIQNACSRALTAGFTVRDGFTLVEDCAKAFPSVPLFIMSYASLLVRAGMEEFLRRAKNAGASGIIVPDLPCDCDEGLYSAGEKTGLAVVPVTVTGMPAERLRRVLSLRPAYIYAALRSGITGSRTELGPENLAFLDSLKGGGAKILAGFGISSREQVEALMPRAEAAVIGSHFVRIIEKNANSPPAQLKAALGRALAELV